MNNWLVKAGQTSRSYDANGNLTKQGADTFTYDSQNRLVAATVAGVTVSYTYNHLDQRVTKTLNGHTRLLVYDTAGNLIEELDGHWRRAGGVHLARWDTLGLCSVRTDLPSPRRSLGTPKALTDVSGQVVWKASYSPFGKASIIIQANLQPAIPVTVLRRGDRVPLQLAALLRPSDRAVHYQRPSWPDRWSKHLRVCAWKPYVQYRPDG